MLQFDVEPYRIVSDVAHKPRYYIHLFVASGLISNVLGFVLVGAHTASTNKRLIRLRRMSTFLPPASRDVSRGRVL